MLIRSTCIRVCTVGHYRSIRLSKFYSIISIFFIFTEQCRGQKISAGADVGVANEDPQEQGVDDVDGWTVCNSECIFSRLWVLCKKRRIFEDWSGNSSAPVAEGTSYVPISTKHSYLQCTIWKSAIQNGPFQSQRFGRVSAMISHKKEYIT